MKKIKLYITTLIVALGLGAPALAPVTVLAATPKATVCQTLGSNAGCTSDPSNGVSLTNVIRAVIQILSIVIGVVAVIMIMIGGFKYVTSGGDSSSVSSAKNTILYAVVGLVVAGLAQIIVFYVLGKVK